MAPRKNLRESNFSTKLLRAQTAQHQKAVVIKKIRKALLNALIRDCCYCWRWSMNQVSQQYHIEYQLFLIDSFYGWDFMERALNHLQSSVWLCFFHSDL